MASEKDDPGVSQPEGGKPEPVPPAPDVHDPRDNYSDGYGYEPPVESAAPPPAPPPAPPAKPPAPPAKASTPPPPKDPEDEEDDGMLRMSFLEHLEELRKRILRMLAGIGVAFLLSLTFTNELWNIISDPAVDALKKIGARPKLAFMTPTEAFSVIWMKLPILTAIFIASPWVLYQVWAFIAPGLYKRERRWAVPFVLSTAGLFIIGGLFSYFVLFRFALAFLLGIGMERNAEPVISITEYFNTFVNVTLGVGIVFELPILIFFLSLLRILSVRFLLANTRYAVLLIVIAAAIITPTPDVINLMMFSIPMILLYFVGILAAWVLELHRAERRFPWGKVFLLLAILAALAGGGAYLAIAKYGYKLIWNWPFLVK
jgi:sec-independent protein translocase protein TatC